MSKKNVNTDEPKAKISQIGIIIDFFKTPVFFIFLLFLIPVLGYQSHYLKKIQGYRPYRDSLYLPSGKLVKPLALGFDMTFADFLWLRAIQSFGGHYFGDKDYSAVYNLFDVITDLDPHFIEAYTFGNLVMGDEGGNQEKALALIDKGIEKNPYDYRLPYEALYIANWSLKDKKMAKNYAVLATLDKNCPDYISRILITLEKDMGRYEVAYDKLIKQTLESYKNPERIVFEVNLSKMREVLNQWNLDVLRSAAKKFRDKEGRIAKSVEEIYEKGYITEYSVPDIEKFLVSAEKYSVMDKPLASYTEEINRESFVKSDKIPVAPFNDYKDYIILNGYKPDDENYLVDKHTAVENLQLNILPMVRAKITQYKEQYGFYPTVISEAFNGVFKLEEPFGGQWLYNSENGEFKSSVFPKF